MSQIYGQIQRRSGLRQRLITFKMTENFNINAYSYVSKTQRRLRVDLRDVACGWKTPISYLEGWNKYGNRITALRAIRVE